MYLETIVLNNSDTEVKYPMISLVWEIKIINNLKGKTKDDRKEGTDFVEFERGYKDG